MNETILIAGIGNIFMGDDAFGVEVVSALRRRRLHAEVRIEDFGIRSYDFAFALTYPYKTIILVDAMPSGQPPGTTFLLELDLNSLPETNTESPDAHSLNPISALQLAKRLGTISAKLYLVGCEPAVLQTDQIGLSAPVSAAVPKSVAMIEELTFSLTGEEGRERFFQEVDRK